MTTEYALADSEGANQRRALFDNARLILILLVVLGHFSEQYYASGSRLLTAVRDYVYIFHMPALLFLSGLFSKKTIDHLASHAARLFQYLALFVVTIFAIWLLNRFWLNPEMELSFIRVPGVAWYLLAVVEYILLMQLLRRVKPLILLPASVMVAVLAGLVPWIGDYFVLSRMLVFAPFFIAGYFVDPEQLEGFVRTSARWIGAALGAAAAAVAAAVVFLPRSVVLNAARLESARNAYAKVSMSWWEGMAWRFALLLLAAVLTAAVIWLAPRGRSLFGGAGERTLQVYALHRIVLYVLVGVGLDDWLRRTVGTGWAEIWLLIGVLLTALLGLKPLTAFVAWPNLVPVGKLPWLRGQA